MGAQLVALALARWAPHISDRAFRVLVRMAITALDNDNGNQSAGMYFGGPELLAMTLRPRRGGTDESAYRIVRYAVAELISVGAIECVEKPRKGTRGVYRLTLDAEPLDRTSDRSRDRSRDVFRNPGSSIAEPRFRNNADSGTQTTKTDALRSPLGTIGTNTRQERQEEEARSLPTQVQNAREDDEPSNEIDFGGDETSRARSAACDTCDTYLEPDGSCFNCARKTA